MHILDIFQAHPTTFSFEFFPPKTDEASEELFRNIAQLQALRPSFVSVTYGAGGSTRERTHDLVVRIQRETDLTAVSHLTCVCHSKDELTAILDRYAASGIENILALGGDLPGDPSEHAPSDYRYASDLIEDIAGADFSIGVAAHPEVHPRSPDRAADRRMLVEELDAF